MLKITFVLWEKERTYLIVEERLISVLFSSGVLVLLHAVEVVADGEEEGEVPAHDHQHRHDAEHGLEPHA